MGVAIGNAIIGFYDCTKCYGAGEIGGDSCAKCDRRYKHRLQAIADSLARSIMCNVNAPLSDVLADLAEVVPDKPKGLGIAGEAGKLAAEIEAFDRKTEGESYTDTGEAWEYLHAAEETLLRVAKMEA